MLNNFIKFLLMAPEPSVPPATPPAAPATPPATPPAEPPADLLFNEPPPAPATPPGTPPTEPVPPSVVIPENWKDILPEEMRTKGIMGNIKTVDQLAKAFFNAEKMVGADKIVVPQKGAKPEEYRAIYEKLGLPKTVEEYKLLPPAGVEIDQNYFADLKKVAFEAGIMPEQAAKFLEFIDKQDKAAATADTAKAIDERRANINKLKAEWGEAFTENSARAKAALKAYVSDEDAKRFSAMGLGADPGFLKLLAAVGGELSEDQIKTQGGTGKNVYSPQEAQAKIAELKGKDTSGAYYDKNHPDHATIKAEVNRLYPMAFPTTKK